MAWVRIDDHFPDHPKIVAAGELTAYLYVAGLCYANRLLTNGFIPGSQVERLVPFRQEHNLSDSPLHRARRLCDLNLWAEGERKGVPGYLIHDYLKYQPSKKHVLAEREKTAIRQGRFRHGHSNAVTTPVSNAPRNGPVTPVPIPIPIPEEKKRATHVGPPTKPADPRVREFLTWFQDEYKRLRNGADYLVKWDKHGRLVKQMLGATDLDRLKKFAQILLNEKTDDAFIVSTDRGIEILSARFSWLSDRLAAWETRQRTVVI